MESLQTAKLIETLYKSHGSKYHINHTDCGCLKYTWLSTFDPNLLLPPTTPASLYWVYPVIVKQLWNTDNTYQLYSQVWKMCISLYAMYIVLADSPVHLKAVCNKSTIALQSRVCRYSKKHTACYSGNTTAVKVGVHAQAWKLLGDIHVCPSCAQACIYLHCTRSGQIWTQIGH